MNKLHRVILFFSIYSFLTKQTKVSRNIYILIISWLHKINHEIDWKFLYTQQVLRLIPNPSWITRIVEARRKHGQTIFEADRLSRRRLLKGNISSSAGLAFRSFFHRMQLNCHLRSQPRAQPSLFHTKKERERKTKHGPHRINAFPLRSIGLHRKTSNFVSQSC